MNLINQKTIIAIFALVSAAASAEVDSTRGLTSEPIFCRDALDCGQCANWGCSWAAGQCLESCSEIADAACFNGEGMCEMAHEEEDNNALCGAQTDCGSCTSTILSGGEGNCFWHPGWQSCKPLVCDAWSCGTDTCLSPEEEQCFIAGDTGGCNGCLESGCEWSGGSCLSSCDMMADAACYTPSNFADKTTDEICEVANTAELDEFICGSATGCEACTSALKSDGKSSCQWYTDEFGISWCGTGACDMFGNCGSDTCLSIPVPLPEEHAGQFPEEIPVPLPEEVAVQLPEEIPVPLPEEIAVQLPEAIPVPLPQSCNTKASCSACLSQDNTCAWIAGSCQESCDVIADAACYTLQSGNGQMSGAEICEWLEGHQADEELCNAKKDCQECTSTFMSGGKSNCSWYTDKATHTFWCGNGSCDMNGNCGSDDASECPAHGNMRGGSKKRKSFFDFFLP